MVSDVINNIEKEFGIMTVTRGKEHVFVGMGFKLNEDGTVSISMNDYIEECIASYGEEISKNNTKTPANSKLFNVNVHSTRLYEDKSEIFHHIVAKLLFVMKRVRLDISTTIEFLSSRVTKSTKVDWVKLKRLLEYLYNTKNMERIIGMDGLSIMKTYVDASYAVHPDMRGHSGGLITVGKGVIHIKTNKQKLNTKSSTETELVAASDYIPWTVWITKVLYEQGYGVDSTFFQDNENAIRMEKYGLKSCGDKSRHINIRYFFIKDILDRENISVKHCRSEEMIADFLTKPLQGSLFKRMRSIIMGHDPFTTEERVGKYITSKAVDE